MNKRTLLTIVVAASLCSCKKNINVNFKDTQSTVVIEGIITDGPGPYFVNISRSANISQETALDRVENAIVIISNNNVADTLSLVSPGLYKTNKTNGVVGNTYVMDVYLGNVHYTASSTIPMKVNMDSVVIENGAFGFNSDNRQVVPKFTDPAGVKNYYRFKKRLNGNYIDDIFVTDDQFTDGKPNDRPLISADNPAKKGDTVEIKMMCIDAGVYRYFFSLDQNSGQGPNSAATPANPITNIKGGALGYFSAQTEQTVQVYIPK